MKSRMAFLVLGLILCLSLANMAAAQTAPGLNKIAAAPHSTITITMDGLGCTTALGSNSFDVLDYSFGARQETSSLSGGGGTGKPVVLPLNATKKFDECSPKLFGAVVSGKHFATVELVQQDEKGNPILTINMTEVLVESYQIGGSQSNDTPRESIQIDFRKICIAEPGTSTKECFDRMTNTAS